MTVHSSVWFLMDYIPLTLRRVSESRGLTGDPAANPGDPATIERFSKMTRASLRRRADLLLRNHGNTMKLGWNMPRSGGVTLPKSVGSYNLLNAGQQTKTDKGEGKGYMTFTLSLTPAAKASKQFGIRGMNTCPNAGFCKGGCIDETGRNAMTCAENGRLWRTYLLYVAPELFHAMLRKEIVALTNRARKKGYRAAFRLNCLSDLDWSATVQRFGGTTTDPDPDKRPIFYDYTKMIGRGVRIAQAVPHYHLAFSKSERLSWVQTMGLLKTGHRVAAVVDCKPKEEHPTYDGIECANGDNDDLIFLHPPGTMITLSFKAAKGRAARLKESIQAGFTVPVHRSTNQIVVNAS